MIERMIKPRALAILLIASNLAFTSVSQAQMWGTGMYGGMQNCQTPNGPANGAVSEDDEVNELQEWRRDKRKEKRDAERRLRDLDSKKEKYTNAINEGVNGNWAGVVLEHMENGYNCRCDAPPPISYQPAPPPIQVQPPMDREPPPIMEPEPEPAPPPEPRPARRATDIFEPSKQSRMPAADVPSYSPAPQGDSYPQGQVSAGTSAQNPWDRGFGGGGGPGEIAGGGMCGQMTEQKQSRAWQSICRNGGGMSREVCRNPFFRGGDGKGASVNECSRAIDDYRKVTREADRLRNKISSLDDEIERIGIQIGDLKRDRKYDKDLEASCPTGDCYKRRGRSEAKSSNIWGTVLPLAAGVLGGLGAEYLGYQANKQNNTQLNKLGWPTMPYQAGQYGFPFVQAGIYGAVAGSQTGSFGCNGMNPMAGPFGGMNPYGMGGMNQQGYGGAFGYPNGMFPFNPMGGGMYAPGMGPWGQAGPWGNGYNPYGGGMGMVGGFAGGGMMPGMAGGFAGMPGMAGGIGMAMPGYAGGFAGMPGMAGGYAGMPGMAGGFAGMPGMAGGIGMAMPGYAGGMAMPGYAGGFSTPGMVGGIGLAGGLQGGFTSPYGIAGGFSGGGFLTPVPQGMMGGMAGGMAGGGMYGQPYALQGQLAQYQMQIDMQRRATDNYSTQMRTQQGLMTEYQSLMYRMQQVNSGGGGLVGGFAGGIGGGLYGGYGLGVTVDPTLGGGYGLATPNGAGVPGRTR